MNSQNTQTFDLTNISQELQLDGVGGDVQGHGCRKFYLDQNLNLLKGNTKLQICPILGRGSYE